MKMDAEFDEDICKKIRYLWCLFSATNDLCEHYLCELDMYKKFYKNYAVKTDEKPESKNQFVALLIEISSRLHQQRRDLLDSIENIINSIKEVQNFVLCTKFGEWKSNQLLASNGDRVSVRTNICGNRMKTSLDEIQKWIGELFQLLKNMQVLLNSVNKSEICEQFNNQLEKVQFDVNTQQEILLRACFVVEIQPPQIIKKDTR